MGSEENKADSGATKTESEVKKPEKRGLASSLKLGIAAVLLVLFTTIVVQNTELVTLRILFWDLTMSRILLLGFALLAGAVIGYLVASLRRTA